MNKQFISYEQAVALKELGFDESCLAFYNLFLGKPTIPTIYFQEGCKTDDCYWIKNSGTNTDSSPDEYVAAPLHQQAFEWFREKFKLPSEVRFVANLEVYDYRITKIGVAYNNSFYDGVRPGRGYTTYKEAQSACLDKLIEISKE